MSRYYDLKTKMKAIRLYLSGKGSDAIGRQLGVSSSQALRWVNLYNKDGKKSLSNRNRVVDQSRKVEAVRLVLEKGLSCEQVAIEHDLGRSSVARWVKMVRNTNDYGSLKTRTKQTESMGRPKKKRFEDMTELEQLRYENAYLKAENALLKKVRALVEEREQSEQKTGRKPSKN